jgi:hypothetical protein
LAKRYIRAVLTAILRRAGYRKASNETRQEGKHPLEAIAPSPWEARIRGFLRAKPMNPVIESAFEWRNRSHGEVPELFGPRGGVGQEEARAKEPPKQRLGE